MRLAASQPNNGGMYVNKAVYYSPLHPKVSCSRNCHAWKSWFDFVGHKISYSKPDANLELKLANYLRRNSYIHKSTPFFWGMHRRIISVLRLCTFNIKFSLWVGNTWFLIDYWKLIDFNANDFGAPKAVESGQHNPECKCVYSVLSISESGKFYFWARPIVSPPLNQDICNLWTDVQFNQGRGMLRQRICSLRVFHIHKSGIFPTQQAEV